jgi:hypothetical protein
MAGRDRMQLPPVKYSITRLGGGVTPQGVQFPGGLDLTTPSLALQPGALRAGLNFECSQSGGYGRIIGYERFDGRAKPSAASYQILQFPAFTNLPVVGNTLTQATSGATGKAIAVNNAMGAFYVAVTQVSGTFDLTHLVSVGATPIGIPQTPSVSISAKTNAIYLAAAADVYRALIQAVPGSGKILGVVHGAFGGIDTVYAFRNNVGATAVNLYKSTAGGWVQINFYDIVAFTAGGTATPQDGETLTQGGVTATVKRVMTQTGAWTGTAAGQFVITVPSGGGGNFAAGAATLSGGAAVTLSGVQTAITMLPGGRFEFARANFSGQPSSKRIYGCDGVNPPFEFDGDVLAPIKTGLSPNAPTHITFHKNILIISQGGSLLGSAPGLPFVWDAGVGAWEIATGDTITGFVTVAGSQSTPTLSVFMRNNCAFLYGTDPTTFVFTPFNTGLGAIPYSVQNLFDTFFFDDLGIVTTRTTLNYGNFLPTALTKNIEPLIIQERGKITCSTINRTKSQYRVFFSDGYGLYLTMVNQSYLGVAQMSFPNPVYVIDNDTDSLGNEVTYFGSTDTSGFVYQLDSGTGFDGANLDAYITLAWDAIKSPEILKRFRMASVEMQGNAYAEFQFGYQLSYGSQYVGQPGNVTYPSAFTGAPNWDSFTWDNFVWDGQTLAPTRVRMTGTGENVQVTISSTGNYIDAFQINSCVYHYSDRRGLRG